MPYIIIFENMCNTMMTESLIQFAAHDLYKQAKQWEEKDNDMIVAIKHMASQMMHMSKFAK